MILQFIIADLKARLAAMDSRMQAMEKLSFRSGLKKPIRADVDFPLNMRMLLRVKRDVKTPPRRVKNPVRIS